MRLIDADARVTVQSFDVEHEEYCHTEMSVAEALDFATDEGCPPAVDAEPVRHGRWHHTWTAHDGSYRGACTKCGFIKFYIKGHDAQYKYCPNCGALMDGGDPHA